MGKNKPTGKQQYEIWIRTHTISSFSYLLKMQWLIDPMMKVSLLGLMGEKTTTKQKNVSFSLRLGYDYWDQYKSASAQVSLVQAGITASLCDLHFIERILNEILTNRSEIWEKSGNLFDPSSSSLYKAQSSSPTSLE